MNNLFKMSEWLREYEIDDPEPSIKFTMPNRFTHHTAHSHADIGDLGADTVSMLKHIDWHKRMTKAYLIVKEK